MAIDAVWISDGSSRQLSYTSRSRDREEVEVAVSGLPTDETAADSAETEAVNHINTNYASQDNFSPNDTTLPLADTKIKVWSVNASGAVAIVRLIYARGEGDRPFSNAFDLADITFYESVDSYVWKIYDGDTDSFSDAPIDEDFTITAFTDFLIRRSVDRPKMEVTVPIATTTEPAANTQSLFHYVNSDEVVIRGKTFAVHTLKYMGMRSSSIDKRPNIQYGGDYIFHYRPDDWGNIDRVVKGSGTDTITYRLVTDPPDETASFVDQFPVHDGTGPAAPSP